MIKRFLIVFGLILLFMVLWAGVLLLVFFIAEDADVVALITVPVIFITFIPYVNFIAKNVFHFKGEGAPISGDELRSRIMEINDINVPVMVQKRKKKLIATWKYVDAKWWEILSKAGLKKIIELLMKFNDRKKEVILSDVTKSISWKAGPTKVRVWGGFTRGIALEYEAREDLRLQIFISGDKSTDLELYLEERLGCPTWYMVTWA